MQPKQPQLLRWFTLLTGIIALFTLVPAKSYGWQCPPARYSWKIQKRNAVYLGTYQDLQGNKASYFWSTKDKKLIGPLDHQRKANKAWSKPKPKNRMHLLPQRKKRGRGKPTMGALPTAKNTDPQMRWRLGLPKGWKIGSIGTLRMASVYYTYMKKHRSDGYFLSFRATAKQLPLASLFAKARSPFVVGLLLGKYAAKKSAQAHFRTRKDRRSQQAYLMLGVSYNAQGVAKQWLQKYRYRDIGGFYLYGLSVMARQGLRGLAKLPNPKHPMHWSDYLPAMAKLWLAGKRKQMEPLLDRSFRQYGLPTLPVLQPYIRLRGYSCPPYRNEVRGPFQVRRDLSLHRMWRLLARKEPQFARAFGKLFQGVQASSKAFVVARFRRGKEGFVLLRSAGRWKVLQLSAQQQRQLKVGSSLRYVTRGKKRTKLPFLPKLRVPYLSLSALSGTPKLYPMKRDVAGMLKQVKFQARSGSLAPSAGLAVHALYHLTKAGLPGWKHNHFRKYMWSLPGNRYRRPWRWLSSWQRILRYALIYNMSPDFADELFRSMPQILLRMQKGSAGSSKSPGGIVVRIPRGLRRFVVSLAAQAALTHLAHKRVREAGALLARVAKHGSTFVPKGMRWDPGSTRDNPSAMLRAARFLVMAHTKKNLLPSHLGYRNPHAAALLRGLMSPYKKKLQRHWLLLLHRAGYPLYKP